MGAPPCRPTIHRAVVEECVSSSRTRPWRTNDVGSGSSSSREGRGLSTRAVTITSVRGRANEMAINRSCSRLFLPLRPERSVTIAAKEVMLKFPYRIVHSSFPAMPIGIHSTHPQVEGPPATQTRTPHRFHCWIRHRSWIQRDIARRALFPAGRPR
jgi:hypothetical protein